MEASFVVTRLCSCCSSCALVRTVASIKRMSRLVSMNIFQGLSSGRDLGKRGGGLDVYCMKGVGEDEPCFVVRGSCSLLSGRWTRNEPYSAARRICEFFLFLKAAPGGGMGWKVIKRWFLCPSSVWVAIRRDVQDLRRSSIWFGERCAVDSSIASTPVRLPRRKPVTVMAFRIWNSWPSCWPKEKNNKLQGCRSGCVSCFKLLRHLLSSSPCERDKQDFCLGVAR